jgi:hypothetical protein
MTVMRVERVTLATMLRRHGEDDLADRVASLTDDEMTRIGRLGYYYAFSEDALAFGGSMGGARALSLAALDVLEGSGRDLGRHHTEVEVVEWRFSEEPDVMERSRDRELRRHAAEKQQPTLDG